MLVLSVLELLKIQIEIKKTLKKKQQLMAYLCKANPVVQLSGRSNAGRRVPYIGKIEDRIVFQFHQELRKKHGDIYT